MLETKKVLNEYLLNEQARIISPSIQEFLQNFKCDARDVVVKIKLFEKIKIDVPDILEMHKS